MAWYLFQLGKLHAATSVVCAGVTEGASYPSPVLLVSPLLPVWLTCLYFLPGQSAFIQNKQIDRIQTILRHQACIEETLSQKQASKQTNKQTKNKNKKQQQQKRRGLAFESVAVSLDPLCDISACLSCK